MSTSETTEPIAERATFDSLPLSDEVRRALEDIGYVHPTSVQEATYEPAVEGKDIIVQARTGTGKTAAFAIPMCDRILTDEPAVQALVLAPTRELALQSARELDRIGKHKGIHTVPVYGGAPMGRQIQELEGGAQIVSGTPGRVLDHLKRGTLDPSRLRVLVLDEMDEMLSMGFARELNAILEMIPGPDKRQTMCFSATVDGDIRRTAERHMRDPLMVSLSSDAVGAEEITHYAYLVSGRDRIGDLIRILEIEDPESAIIFCNLRSETEKVASALQQAGFNADWLNGDLPQREREKVMSRTREGKLRYLVATDVAARGIDISHLTHVVNFSFPEATAVYVHRTGRTGRAGRTGCAISLVSPQELGRLYYLRLEYKIFPVERSLPTRGELRTRQEADRIALLEEAVAQGTSSEDRALARRLLTHPEAERIVGGLLHAFFGSKGGDVDEQAAAARRARSTRSSDEEEVDSGEREEARRTPRKRDPDGERRSRKERRPRERRRDRDEERVQPREREPGTARESERPGSLASPREVDGRPAAILFLDLGRKDGVRVGEIARLLREVGELSRSEVGRIRVRDRHTFVDVPEDRIDALVERLQGEEVNDKVLSPERAKVNKAS